MQKSSKKAPREVIFNLVFTALLIALQVIISRFLSIQLLNHKIGFSFVPVVIAARMFGPLGAMAVYGIGDIIGALAFPSGAYFPGFTASAIISGLIFGLFLWKKSNPVRVTLAVFLNQLITSFLLNSLWLSITTGKPFITELAIRWPQSLIMGVVQIVLMVIGLEKLCVQLEKVMSRQIRTRAA